MTIDVLTREKLDEITSGLGSRLKLKGRNANFISGNVINNSRTDITLIYEIPWSKKFEAFAKLLELTGSTILEEFYRGPIHIVKPKSLESFRGTEQINSHEDMRYLLFGSRSMYKAFLAVLDAHKLNGYMTGEEYMYVIRRIDLRYLKLHAETKGNSLFNTSALAEFRNVFENDPLLRPYIILARESLGSLKIFL